MKKFFAALLCASLCLVTACASNPLSSSLPASSEPPAPSEAVVEPLAPSGAEEEPVEEPSQEQKMYVADAAMYRGTITAMKESEAGVLMTLEQAKGTDFGAASIEALLPPDARLSFSADQLEVGGYLEIFYGGALEAQPLTVIAANLYPSADMVNFNGVVETIRSATDGTGSFILRDIENGQQVVYHYSADQTQLYLDLAQVREGDQLNIFHRGFYTMSLPPQGSALEVRKIEEPLPAAPAQPDPLQVPA